MWWCICLLHCDFLSYKRNEPVKAAGVKIKRAWKVQESLGRHTVWRWRQLTWNSHCCWYSILVGRHTPVTTLSDQSETSSLLMLHFSTDSAHLEPRQRKVRKLSQVLSRMKKGKKWVEANRVVRERGNSAICYLCVQALLHSLIVSCIWLVCIFFDFGFYLFLVFLLFLSTVSSDNKDFVLRISYFSPISSCCAWV